MRVSIEISEDLYREANSLAVSRGVRLEELVEEGLRRVLSETDPVPGRTRVTFPLHRSRHPGSMTTEDLLAAEHAMLLEEDKVRGGSS